jgi:hypothetical protein
MRFTSRSGQTSVSFNPEGHAIDSIHHSRGQDPRLEPDAHWGPFVRVLAGRRISGEVLSHRRFGWQERQRSGSVQL